MKPVPPSTATSGWPPSVAGADGGADGSPRRADERRSPHMPDEPRPEGSIRLEARGRGVEGRDTALHAAEERIACACAMPRSEAP